ncbi:kinase [Mesobacillus boroniphilus]|uniref:Uridine kinase n=1 Tax=Mesobacillus boroniphilus JCM 21738 TaxID=1294265 RepID=W4RJ81_9BACI|nr:kinase [Mesobacillus boroniphilus]GAE44480.1 uridine kinase [Mesobacillus boroniphilus JCM 21738]
MDAVDILMTKIVSAVRQNKQIILGIDGLSRSGKTTFVKKFASVLSEKQIENMVFHLDDHIVGRSKRYNTGHEEWQEYYFLQWDVEWLSKSLLGNLVHSNEIELPFYDHKLDEHVYQKLQLNGKDVFIVEGVFLQRKEWRPYLDFTVFIDCPRDIRFARESYQTQQKIARFRNRYWKAEGYYMENLRPVEKADLVIPYYELIN